MYPRFPCSLFQPLGLVVLLGQPACTDVSLSPSAVVGVLGVEWTLIEIDGQPAGVGAGDAAATLLMATGEVRGSGFAGCNRFTGAYELVDDRLQFGQTATTRMFCAQEMDLERRYLAALAATRRYRRLGERLEFLGDAGVVARFESPRTLGTGKS